MAKHKKTKQKAKNTEIDESKLLAQQAEREKRQRDRALNQQKERAAKQRAIVAQIKQLIETSQVDLTNGEIAFNFNDQAIVKRIYVTAALHDQISGGKLAIAKFDERYFVIPSSVANKISERDPAYVIVLNDDQRAEALDDEYSEYQIPDDLMW